MGGREGHHKRQGETEHTREGGKQQESLKYDASNEDRLTDDILTPFSRLFLINIQARGSSYAVLYYPEWLDPFFRLRHRVSMFRRIVHIPVRGHFQKGTVSFLQYGQW
jgi:hypothetical protein